jgi:hypothetical protein
MIERLKRFGELFDLASTPLAVYISALVVAPATPRIATATK